MSFFLLFSANTNYFLLIQCSAVYIRGPFFSTSSSTFLFSSRILLFKPAVSLSLQAGQSLPLAISTPQTSHSNLISLLNPRLMRPSRIYLIIFSSLTPVSSQTVTISADGFLEIKLRTILNVSSSFFWQAGHKFVRMYVNTFPHSGQFRNSI